MQSIMLAMSSSRFPAVVDDVTVRLIAAVVLVIGVVALGTRRPGGSMPSSPSTSPCGPRSDPGQPDRPAREPVDPTRRPAAKRPTAGPPKRFAATIGAVMTVAATALWLSTSHRVVRRDLGVVAIGAIMVLFPLLESAFGSASAAASSPVLMRLGLVPEEVCLDCADITRRRALADGRLTGRTAYAGPPAGRAATWPLSPAAPERGSRGSPRAGGRAARARG